MFSFARAGAAMLLLAPLATLGAQGAPATSAAGQKVVAYIDSKYIVNNAPATPAAMAVLQKEGDAIQAQGKRMSDSLDALTSGFQKAQATLSAEKRDAEVKRISDKQTEFNQRWQALQQQAQEREAEVMQPILDQIKLVIEDIRVEQGYAMIFDVGQNPAIVAADKNLNLSDRVLAKLRTMPVPAVAEKGSGTKAAADPKAQKAGPSGGPLSAPAGVRGAGAPAASKKTDTTAKADSAKPKKPDSTATKKPDGK